MYSTFTLEELLAENDRLNQYAIELDEMICDLLESQNDPDYDPEMIQNEIDDSYDELACVEVDMDALKEEFDRRG